MAIDLETITHDWITPDGETPNGSVRFDLSGQEDASSEATTISTTPIITPLVDGAISQELAPNVDEDGASNGTFYTVTEDVVGSTTVQYPITVPSGSGPYDLWVLRQQS